MAEAAAGPLSGVRVVELGDERIDYCGLVLAGLGAEVVKVEPPEGSPARGIGPFLDGVAGPERSLHFWAYNRGKSSVQVDPESRDDVDAVRALAGSADVLLVGADQGDDLAVDPAGLRAADPTLVVGRLTGFGDGGPWSGFRGSDLVHLALGGVVMNCGYDPEPSGWYDLPPVAPQAWHSHHIAGEQLAIGVLAALLYRQRSGRGQEVACSIHRAVATSTEVDLMSWVMLRRPLLRQTCRHAGPVVSDPAISATKDGRWVLSLGTGARDRRPLGPFLEQFGLGADLPEEEAEVEGVRAIAGSTSAATRNNEYVQRLVRRFAYDRVPWREAQEAGLLWAPLRLPHENLDDQHWRVRGSVAEVGHPELGRTFPYPVSRWTSTAGGWVPGRRAPLLGEDTTTVLGARRTGYGTGTVVRERDGSPGEELSPHGRPFPLQGVRILDFGWFLASAGATRFLAALGADVLKVEWRTHPDSGRGSLVPVGGRAAREAADHVVPSLADPAIGGQFNNKNPGKRGLSLNVAHPEGLEIAKALVERSDVVTEGFSPGVLERWGLGYEVQRGLRADVIYVKQSGMGTGGSYGRFRSYGPIAAALSGLSEMSGLPGQAPPAGWGYSYLDWFAAYSMALAVLGALFHRERTGEGQWIDASQAEVGIALTAVPMLDRAANGTTWTRSGNRNPYHPGAPEGIYRCAGPDHWIAISCYGDAQWRRLVEIAGRGAATVPARLDTAQARMDLRAEVDRLVGSWTAGWERYELMAALQAAGIAAGVCQTAGDRVDLDPQLRADSWLTELTGTRIGRWPLAELPFTMSETPPYLGGRVDRAAPLYGEDTEQILGELLGMSAAEVQRLREKGVV